jgi:hypothetical protein
LGRPQQFLNLRLGTALTYGLGGEVELGRAASSRCRRR